VKLGGLNAGGIAKQQAAADFAEQLRPVFTELADLSARQVAATLNERGIKAANGGQFRMITPFESLHTTPPVRRASHI
jgi:hypothetical protein